MTDIKSLKPDLKSEFNNSLKVVLKA